MDALQVLDVRLLCAADLLHNAMSLEICLTLPGFGDTTLTCQSSTIFSHFKETVGACLIIRQVVQVHKIFSFTSCVTARAPTYPIWLVGDALQISETCKTHR